MSKKPLLPWDFVPANDDTRYNFPVGAGKYEGKGRINNQGRIRVSSTVSPPKDKTSGFKKPITQA